MLCEFPDYLVQNPHPFLGIEISPPLYIEKKFFCLQIKFKLIAVILFRRELMFLVVIFNSKTLENG